jgi:hypothetical protein
VTTDRPRAHYKLRGRLGFRGSLVRNAGSMNVGQVRRNFTTPFDVRVAIGGVDVEAVRKICGWCSQH